MTIEVNANIPITFKDQILPPLSKFPQDNSLKKNYVLIKKNAIATINKACQAPLKIESQNSNLLNNLEFLLKSQYLGLTSKIFYGALKISKTFVLGNSSSNNA